jgi:hypothetical protein
LEYIIFILTFKALKSKSLIEPCHIPQKKEHYSKETGALSGEFVCLSFSLEGKFLGRKSSTITGMHMFASKENFDKNKIPLSDLFFNSG